MNSPTPWWGTLVVAAVGLVGVLVSQWISVRRDRIERQDRLRVARLELYHELNRVVVKLTDALRHGEWDRARELGAEFGHAVLPVALYGRASLGPAIDTLNRQLGDLLQRPDLDDVDPGHAASAVMQQAGILVTIMRGDVGRPPRWYVRVLAWLTAPRRAARAARLRWQQDWTVVQADIEQPIWPTVRE